MIALLLACATEPPVYGTGPAVYSEPISHVSDDWLFSDQRIYRIDLTISDVNMEILREEALFSYPRTEVRAEATIDGLALGEIGVRLRGGLGSFRSIDDKPKLELDLNAYSGERFFGLESLSLNNMVADCSGLREAIVMAAYRMVGVPASRTGFAQLFLNGADYGLMLVVETQDDRWLRRQYADGSIRLYDGKYVYAGMWPRFVDFGAGRDDWFDLEEGEDIGFADIIAVSTEVEAAAERGTLSETLWSQVDWLRLARMLHVERLTGNDDGYSAAPNNYRVAFPANGPAVLSPWDLDATLRVRWPEDGDTSPAQVVTNPDRYTSPGGNLAAVCLDDPDCRALWEETGETVRAQLWDGTLLDLAERLDALTLEGRTGDPRLQECDRIVEERDAILAYLETGESGITEGCDDDSSAVLVVPLLLSAGLRRRRQTIP